MSAHGEDGTSERQSGRTSEPQTLGTSGARGGRDARPRSRATAGPRSAGSGAEPRYSYRNLELWKRAQEFAHAIVLLVEDLPSGRSVDSVARQIVRSATSIGANIAEGHGRFGPAAYKNHLSIANGSACETDSWLDLLRRLELISAEREAELHENCSTLIAALTGRIRDLERTAARAVREEQAEYAATAGSEVPGF